MIHVDDAIRRLLEKDPWLEPYAGEVRMHLDRYNDCRWRLAGDKPISEFANGHHYFGFHRTDTGWVFREWLPGADAAWLTGDFNGWDKYACPLEQIGNGVWEIALEGRDALKHGQFVKLVVGRLGSSFERIPAYMTRCVMDESTYQLCGQIWMPDEPFAWTDGEFYCKQRPESPMIYEAHIGMAQEKDGIGTYREFADDTLPWIKNAGYNTVQLMAIQEHPYYASFGYQVTNFFAPSHRYGTPEDLKYLIDRAHGMGISVLLDVVHSHACPNLGEGLNQQDGTEDQYFLYGGRGWHPAWETRIFDYGKHEVLHFLLSNLKYWQEEFHFDGFRFDGVTSMMYENHGLCAFGSYDSYFSMNTNVDGRVYLMLANELVHGVNEKAMTVAEEMSGFPGMCLPLEYGGVGFDYRLAMGMPDIWIKLVKDMRQVDWDMFYLWHELTSCRPGEMSVGYAESHDQALVGDKSLMFRMADAEMYTGMMKDYHSPSMDRAIDMHKLIRLLTCSLAANGYLNFIGNEFGHPEWVDFPREGNNWSYHYARRQWSLVKSADYKYEWLANFDRAMTWLMNTRRVHCSGPAESLWIDNEKKLLLFARDGMLFAFNMHPTWSQESVFIDTRITGPGEYRVVLSTDAEEFGGQNRIDTQMIYRAGETPFGTGLQVYLPCRTAVVLEKVEA
ncbi:MAG: alpha amylase C-terminal domain-containing protein [Clostridia bacterium]|nr:alpha amylase C-terminal domain-containing protein [Clostridia bacterium]